jgi:hypothetical protein
MSDNPTGFKDKLPYVSSMGLAFHQFSGSFGLYIRAYYPAFYHLWTNGTPPVTFSVTDAMVDQVITSLGITKTPGNRVHQVANGRCILQP